MLDLTAPRVRALLASNDRQWGIDAALIGRSNDVVARAREGHQQRTRAELRALLAEAGIVTDSSRLGQLMMHAELEGLICSGPRRGKQLTYALLTERAPQARRLAREEALAKLTRRYYVGHGPATVHDFAWWSGLTLADARAGLAMGAGLEQAVLDGEVYWSAHAPAPNQGRADEVLLLPTYDELVVGYHGFDTIRRGGADTAGPLVFESPLVAGGTVIGSWKRTLRAKEVVIELAPFVALTGAQQVAVEAAVQRYTHFVGVPARTLLYERGNAA